MYITKYIKVYEYNRQMGYEGEAKPGSAGINFSHDGLGICGGCERFYDGSCWRIKTDDDGNHIMDGKYKVGHEGLILLTCHAWDYNLEALYKPIKLQE